MKKIKLTESQLNKVIVESAKRLIKESTGNFYVKNANKYYVIGIGENGENTADEFTVENLCDSAEENGWDSCGGNWIGEGEREVALKEFGNVCATIIARIGYYAGIALDYEISYSEGPYSSEYKLSDYDSEEDMLQDIYSEFKDAGVEDEFNPEDILNNISDAQNSAEELCNTLSESRYACMGSASNGEQFFRRID